MGLRRDEEWLKENFIEPYKLVPGTFMPSFAHLPEEDLKALVAFLQSLK